MPTRCHGGATAVLTSTLALFFAWVSALSAAHAQEPPTRPRTPTTDAAPEPDCTRMLFDAAAALRNEQYPSMSQIAAERQRACPGPDSLFLMGIAKANMVHNALVSPESEPLVRAQAIRALKRALDSDALRGEWLQPANAWLQYLQRVDRDERKSELPPPPPPSPAPSIIPPAAPPWEPEPSHLGPLLLASGGIGLLGAGLIAAIVAANRDPYDDSSTLNTATEVLILGGGAALVSALTWHLLTPRPTDSVQVSVAANIPRASAIASLRMSF